MRRAALVLTVLAATALSGCVSVGTQQDGYESQDRCWIFCSSQQVTYEYDLTFVLVPLFVVLLVVGIIVAAVAASNRRDGQQQQQQVVIVREKE